MTTRTKLNIVAIILIVTGVILSAIAAQFNGAKNTKTPTTTPAIQVKSTEPTLNVVNEKPLTVEATDPSSTPAP